MRKHYLFLGVAFLQCLFLFASNDDLTHSGKFEIRYVKKSEVQDNYYRQTDFQKSAAWQNFLKKSGSWMVEYNLNSGMPHRAFGKPVPVPGVTASDRAYNFITNNLKDFNIPVNDLIIQSDFSNKHFHFVNYYQQYQGIRVLDSRVKIKFTLNNEVISWGTDVFNDISISTTPQISEQSAAAIAGNGITDVINTRIVKPVLYILPVPVNGKYEYHLVYEVLVETTGSDNIPGMYKSLVDAHNGVLLSRVNEVKYFSNKSSIAANTDVTIDGTVYPTNVNNPSAVKPMVNMKVVVGGTTYYTDNSGYLGLTNSSPVSATVSLEGKWSKVRKNNVTASFTANLNPGTNTVTFTGNATIQELCGYYNVNIVHDDMKQYFPTFTSMDNPLPTNVDLSGTCNAFYNGSSINFYAAGGNCVATSQCADVCYHEYGHGINDKYYQSKGSSWQNGAMGEGYADVWGCSIINDGRLGLGFFTGAQATQPMRDYTGAGKVYPQDIVGEVHADGEIIAGAWWDVGVNVNLSMMKNLFCDTYDDLETAPDGQEGPLFRDILIAALQRDDVPSNGGDNNYCNGTPNGQAISAAFAKHGISLISGATLAHTPINTHAAWSNINITATVTNIPSGCGFQSAFLKWKTVGNWVTVPMTNTGGNNYSGSIPGQQAGNIVQYYVGMLDNTNAEVGVTPAGANNTNDPNIPYFILIDYTKVKGHDFEGGANNFGAFTESGNATTGKWETNTPGAVMSGSVTIQPGTQHTAGGSKCAVTGASGGTNGANDVDNGSTTYTSPTIDLSAVTNPAVTYYRWFLNNGGSNPGGDPLVVEVSDNNGSSWVKVEDTKTSDGSWREFAFKVSDYVTPNATFKMRFTVSDDANGSIVEGLIDDIEIWGVLTTGANELSLISSITLYPNPAQNQLNIALNLTEDALLGFEIYNLIGEKVKSFDASTYVKGANKITVDISDLDNGVYVVRTNINNESKSIKFTVNH